MSLIPTFLTTAVTALYLSVLFSIVDPCDLDLPVFLGGARDVEGWKRDPCYRRHDERAVVSRASARVGYMVWGFCRQRVMAYFEEGGEVGEGRDSSRGLTEEGVVVGRPGWISLVYLLYDVFVIWRSWKESGYRGFVVWLPMGLVPDGEPCFRRPSV